MNRAYSETDPRANALLLVLASVAIMLATTVMLPTGAAAETKEVVDDRTGMATTAARIGSTMAVDGNQIFWINSAGVLKQKSLSTGVESTIRISGKALNVVASGGFFAVLTKTARPRGKKLSRYAIYRKDPFKNTLTLLRSAVQRTYGSKKNPWTCGESLFLHSAGTSGQIYFESLAKRTSKKRCRGTVRYASTIYRHDPATAPPHFTKKVVKVSKPTANLVLAVSSGWGATLAKPRVKKTLNTALTLADFESRATARLPLKMRESEYFGFTDASFTSSGDAVVTIRSFGARNDQKRDSFIYRRSGAGWGAPTTLESRSSRRYRACGTQLVRWTDSYSAKGVGGQIEVADLSSGQQPVQYRSILDNAAARVARVECDAKSIAFQLEAGRVGAKVTMIYLNSEPSAPVPPEPEPPGPTEPTGPTGPSGPTGPTGSTGPTGPTS